MEFEDSKPAKPKDIKYFLNKVEVFGQKGNDDKIGWIAEEKKYPFRIIVVDKSDGHKGIYFSNKDKAEQVRVFLSQNFRYGGNFPQLMASLHQRFTDATLEAFKYRVVQRKRLINKSNRYSRNIIL